jgi:hypothetical protein
MEAQELENRPIPMPHGANAHLGKLKFLPARLFWGISFRLKLPILEACSKTIKNHAAEKEYEHSEHPLLETGQLPAQN